MDNKPEVMKFAEIYRTYGLSFIPLRPKSKKPAIAWKVYQEELPEPDRPLIWFGGKKKNRNIAIVTGAISGNLVVIDFDQKEKYEEFMNKLPINMKISLENTWTVKTGKGYHIYLRIEGLSPEEFKEKFRTKPRLIEGVDIKAEGGYVVAPPSIHPNGSQYEFVRGPPEYGILRVTPQDFEELLGYLGYRKETQRTPLPEEPKVAVSGLKELQDGEIMRVSELLKQAYIPGHRQNICLYLSGWGAWAKISPLCIAKIVKLLHEKTKDEDPLKERLAPIVYSYKKGELWNSQVEEAFLDLIKAWGIKEVPGKNYEPSKKGDEEEEKERPKGRGFYLRKKFGLVKDVKEKSDKGLEKELAEVLGDEKALDVIRQIEEIFKRSSPFKDSIFEIMDYEKQIFAVANLRKGIVARARRKEDSIVYKEIVLRVAPVDVTVYEDPSGGPRKWKIKFEGIKPIEIGPEELDEIIDRLKIEGVVYKRSLLEDVLSAVLNAFIRKGRAKVEYMLPEPGYFLIEEDGHKKVIWNPGASALARSNLPETPDIEKVKEALLVLDKFIREYCNEEPTQITALCLMFATPFGAVRKRLGRNQQTIVLAGEPNTYKTTIAMVGPALMGFSKNDHIAWRTGYITYPQLANGCARHTGAFVINEAPLDFLTLKHADLIAYLKGAPETLSARFLESEKEVKKALASIVITFNDLPVIGDPYLAEKKRLLLVRFENRDKLKQGGRELIEDLINNGGLYHLGAYLRDKVNEIPPDFFKQSMLEVGKRLLAFLYADVFGEVPGWIEKTLSEEDLDPQDRLIEEVSTPDIVFINILKEDVLKAIKNAPRGMVQDIEYDSIDLPKCVELAIKRGLLGYALYKVGQDGKEYVWILPEAKRRLREEGGLSLTLSDLAKALGGKVEPRRIAGRFQKVIILEFEKLIDLIKSITSTSEEE